MIPAAASTAAPTAAAGRRAGRRPWRAARTAARMLAPMSRPLIASLLCVLAAPLRLAGAQDDARPDQVFVRNERTGAVNAVAGVVQSESLDTVVVIDARGKQSDLPSGRVDRIVYGDAPPALAEGAKYFERGMFEDAAAKFRVAAGDAGARPLVQAAAQVRAAEALLAWGARDPLRFEEATAAAQAFLAAHPGHRLTARAQVIAARGLVLSGKAAEGGALYREVFAKLAGGVAAPGYDAPTCLGAGLAAARAALSTGDTLAARELFTALDGALTPLLSAPEDPGHAKLAAIHGEAQLGEGFAELAAGNSKAALAFFQDKLAGLNGSASDAVRSAASLGLGEALLAEGQARRASVEFARVSALDHTDRDRVARAQVRLAQCAEQLKDKDSKKNSCTWLKAVVEHFGDTPSAAEARELIQSMGC